MHAQLLQQVGILFLTMVGNFVCQLGKSVRGVILHPAVGSPSALHARLHLSAYHSYVFNAMLMVQSLASQAHQFQPLPTAISWLGVICFSLSLNICMELDIIDWIPTAS